ncbi:hypothetical protein [Streptomyces orinoci]|uniref:Uncharacterized protein n=1 Tax=Streptomyces orinoci TaxID=67339 RepID=A0ABV3K0F3_STRON|nr:hypothetical protein [Streptomyces orinoci]
MRIQLTWPNTADARLTFTIALPDFTSDSIRPTLRRTLAYAEPVLAGAADVAGAGLLARLMLPLTLHIVQQTLENPARDTQHSAGRTPVPVGIPA